MSSIGAEIIEAEESEGDICWFAGESWHDHCPYCKADKIKEQWRQDTLKMLELSEQWDGVYQQIDGVIGNKIPEKEHEV